MDRAEKANDIRLPALYAAAVGLLFLDRVLKGVAVQMRPADPAGRWALFTPFMNPGIAFSLPLADAVFWPLAAAALGVLVWLFAAFVRRGRGELAALVFMILLGAVSNLADRLAYGATVDYFLFFGRSAVNVADGMIIAGAAAAYLYGRAKVRPAA